MKNYSRDETEFGSFGDRPGRRAVFGASVATTADFFTGQTIAPPAAKAPPPPKGYVPGATAARAALTKSATLTANRNISGGYRAARAADDKAAIAANNRIANASWNTANIDWGLLPAAVATVATVAAPYALPAIAAAAGPVVAAAAPVLAAAAPVIKSIAKSPAAASTVKAADHLLATADTATAAGAKARATLNDTIKAAQTNQPGAVKGLAVLATVATDRAATGTAAGAPGRASFAPTELLNPVRPVTTIKRAVAPPPSIFTTIALDGVSTAAKYLVLDSGQVLAGLEAAKALPGWLVRFDGRVVRQ